MQRWQPSLSAGAAPAMKLGLALHLGFVRMSGRPLDAFRVLPVVLLRHLGKELGIPVPDVASLESYVLLSKPCPARIALKCLLSL